ncbi:MAG: alpha-amylase/4-alpha-glucanotransferase domain-containing protein [Candidatus Acidiferrales bacterium]
MPKFQLVLLIHAHQPVGNFDGVFEHTYQRAYLPFVEVLARHPSVRLALHFTGSLLEWIERAHPEYLDLLRELSLRGQVELVGGGYYEPILISIPLEDRIEQIHRLAGYLEHRFGSRPRGAWLAERVWEPQLPSSLAPAGVEYTLVDDNHFLGAGFDRSQLFGHYLCEDQGSVVRVLPGSKELRYLMPFRDVNDVVDFLRRSASEHPAGFVSMGDDLEKFGVWPGTFELCYTHGWLENLFAAFEQNSDWLELATPAEAISSHVSLGRADLPAASYQEMMEWSLPTPARARYHSLAGEFSSSRPDDMPFLRGGIWRSFFTKYPESNLLHKKMLHVSEKVRRLWRIRSNDPQFVSARDESSTHLLRGQCNDPYWHGVFGGLYTPHLRTALWQSLIRAESLADALLHRDPVYSNSLSLDFDADGREEIYFTSDRYAALLKPDDGGTFCFVECRSTNTNLINSIARRPEAYHARLKTLDNQNRPGVISIHDQTRTKEEGLERWLQYDRWPRHSFRLLLFGRDKTQSDAATARLDEDAALAGGSYRVTKLSPAAVSLASQDSADWPAEKRFSFASAPRGFDVSCDVSVRRVPEGFASVYIALEVIVNFLAPSAPDRYFESAGQRLPLRSAVTLPASELRVVDEWQKLAVTLAAPDAKEFWLAPIETVSESEDGFERIYQGSQILAVWPVELASGAQWDGHLRLSVAPLP